MKNTESGKETAVFDKVNINMDKLSECEIQKERICCTDISTYYQERLRHGIFIPQTAITQDTTRYV